MSSGGLVSHWKPRLNSSFQLCSFGKWVEGRLHFRSGLWMSFFILTDILCTSNSFAWAKYSRGLCLLGLCEADTNWKTPEDWQLCPRSSRQFFPSNHLTLVLYYNWALVHLGLVIPKCPLRSLKTPCSFFFCFVFWCRNNSLNYCQVLVPFQNSYHLVG